MLGPPAGQAGDVDLTEAGTEVGDVGDRARVRAADRREAATTRAPTGNRSDEPDRRRCASA